ncbi:aspartate/glutamate racemase family protein [Pararoseomonas indoligenes]|uniref:Aspartate/glutamate racemase family protein n=1 Tax=Roseomonas indoligenes TaxID=2820811 RepID=A0A940MZF5_9PROT|nr:aspartate/glutamate racemase family protein [Pararoseomonas indoligenes]MBP0495006.1 aspartate/glutamate racemase family protein [Pararoseomonas indoligenes]
MNLLLINPNTSTSVTDRIAGVARAAAAPSTEIRAVTARTGAPYIATRAEAVLGAASVLELLADHANGADAVIIGAFADPGLGAARELLRVPVVGMAEAAMLTACMLGRRFAIVTFSVSLEPWYWECVEYNGLARRCAGVFCLDEPFSGIDDVADEKAARLVELCGRAVAAGADVCILGGAPLAGLAAQVADQVPVPLLDGVAAAVRQAETLAVLGPRKATAGSFRRPAPKPMTGLSPALRRLFEEG